MSGYDIKQSLKDLSWLIGSPSFGSLYPALHALVDDGFATVEAVAGDEIVQLYTRTDGASVTRPVKELRAFRRLELAPGESRRIGFSLPISQLSYYDLNMCRVVEPASVEVMVGSSSADIKLTGAFRIDDRLEIDGDYAMFTTSTVE